MELRDVAWHSLFLDWWATCRLAIPKVQILICKYAKRSTNLVFVFVGTLVYLVTFRFCRWMIHPTKHDACNFWVVHGFAFIWIWFSVSKHWCMFPSLALLILTWSNLFWTIWILLQKRVHWCDPVLWARRVLCTSMFPELNLGWELHGTIHTLNFLFSEIFRTVLHQNE